MCIHFFFSCPLGLTFKLNFNISKVAYSSLVAVSASPNKLSCSTAHQPTSPDKTLWDLALSDIARQTPILSQACLNSLHTSRQIKIFLSADKISARVRLSSYRRTKLCEFQTKKPSVSPSLVDGWIQFLWDVASSLFFFYSSPNCILQVLYFANFQKQTTVN